MSGFRVDYKSVNKIAAQQEDLSADASAGRGYIEKGTDIPFNGEGVINFLAKGHRDTCALAELFHDTLATKVATPSATDFSEAADYYHRVNAAAAEKLDRTYPPSDAGEAKKGLKALEADGAPFTDLCEPTERYTPPGDYSADHAYEPQLVDMFSVTSLFRDAIWGITSIAAQLGMIDRPYDVMESIVKPISGDWAGLRACADVYDNVGSALGDMAKNVQWSGQRLGDVWTGNAADSAEVYLFALAKSLADAEAPFHELAEQYKMASEGAAELGKIVGGLLCDLVDAVLYFIAAAEGAGASASTIVGIPLAVVIADAGLVAEIIKAVEILDKIVQLVELYNGLVDTLHAAQGQFGRILVPENMPRLEASRPAHLPP